MNQTGKVDIMENTGHFQQIILKTKQKVKTSPAITSSGHHFCKIKQTNH